MAKVDMVIDKIKDDINRVLNTYTGNVVEIVPVYNVKSNKVDLRIERTPSGQSLKYYVNVYNTESNVYSNAMIMFNEYPHKSVEYSGFDTNCSNMIIKSNSGVRKAIDYTLRAVGRLYGLPAEKVFVQ